LLLAAQRNRFSAHRINITEAKKLVEEIDLYELMLRSEFAVERIESSDSILVSTCGTAGDCGWNGAASGDLRTSNERNSTKYWRWPAGVLVSGDCRNIKVARDRSAPTQSDAERQSAAERRIFSSRDGFQEPCHQDGDDITVSPFFPTATRPSTFKGHVSGPASIHTRMESK